MRQMGTESICRIGCRGRFFNAEEEGDGETRRRVDVDGSFLF